jgi:hypothetical protein
MFTVSLSRDDWSLHRKGAIDQARHREKVKEALREQLADIVSEQSIITSDGKKIVRVPIRQLEQYRFRFDPNQPRGVGQGEGDTQVGDVLERFNKQGQGNGQQAGDQPGDEVYEAAVAMEDLQALVFEDLELPNLQERRMQELESETIQFSDVRRSGAFSNLDKRRTIKANLKRNALQGEQGFRDIQMDDLRYRTWERHVRRESNAVVIAMMDVSGSMGPFEKYAARAFYFWMVRFLRTKYDNVRIVFISHHTEAREVTEEEFFTRGESGGTKASSAYRLAVELTDTQFKPDAWNIYPFHFSDGDNFISDNQECTALANTLAQRSNLLGYGEIRQGRRSYQSTLMGAFKDIDLPNFSMVTIAEKSDVYQALRSFFGPAELTGAKA